ncbi:MAG: hypothetical protein J6M14_02810 [Campylobacter sp.]|nr:hypothetical protein [Campylobacter sp.]
MDFFKDWEEFNPEGASVKFYRTNKDNCEFIGFDSRSCVPPEPMVNGLVALNLVKDKNTKVVMVNHKFPVGLIPKIEAKFDYERQDLPSGGVKLVFSLKDGASSGDLDTNVSCHG